MQGLHLLADNDDISREDYAKVRTLIDAVRALHLGAPGYVAERRLDPAVFLPGNIWGELNTPDHFTNWTYGLVNYAKCVSPFSGFHSMMWGRLDRAGQVDAARSGDLYARFLHGALDYTELGAVLEREFDLSGRIRADLPRMTAFYDDMVAVVPERYRIAVPPRGGEIGAWHNGRIVHQDLIAYQRRVNALYAGGALQHIEETIASRGSANYLEIGPGHGFFAYALAECFSGALNVFLIDLPLVIGNGCAYLSCAAGVDRIGLVTPDTASAVTTPFVYIPNHLVPAYERFLPQVDLVHNTSSFNEMNAQQVAYYFDLVERHLAPGGIFHIAGGLKVLDYHVDAATAARERFPGLTVYPDREIAGVLVGERPNSFIRG